MKRFFAVIILTAVPMLGQSPSSSTLTAAKPNAGQTQPPLTDEQKKALARYDFTGAINRLNASGAVNSSTPVGNSSSPASSGSATAPRVPPLQQHVAAAVAPSPVPPTWKEPHTVLNSTALEAAAVASNWEASFNLATPGTDGRVVYMFGAGMPVIVCSPLRVCVLELEAGEHIQSQPQIGDSRRWEVTPVSSGSGVDQTPLLILKPIEPGLDTDLVIPTDRRTYVVRLVSDSTRYVSRVAFRYPADDHAKWSSFQAQQDAARRDAELAAEQAAAAAKARDKKDGVVDMAPNAMDKLYFNYKLEGEQNLLPERVLDDGQHTYIFYADNNRFRELPTLMIVVNGKTELVNFRVEGTKFVVDRLFDKAVLIVGVGKKQSKVTITRKDHYVKAVANG